MKILRIFGLCLAISFASAKDFEWVELYKKGGMVAIEQKIDSIMQTHVFWSEALKDQDTRFGYYENLKHLFIATKDAPTLRLYTLRDSKWEEELNINILIIILIIIYHNNIYLII